MSDKPMLMPDTGGARPLNLFEHRHTGWRDDVREMTSEDLEHLVQSHGGDELAAASEVARIAMEQMRTVKIVAEQTPGGRRVLRRVMDRVDVSERDIRAERAQRTADRISFETSAKGRIHMWIAELCGSDWQKADRVWRALEEGGLDRILQAEKRDRRRVFAAEMERIDV